MPQQKETGSTESRANQRRGDSPEYTSPAREVLNSVLSLVAVIGLTLIGGIVANRIVGRKLSQRP